MEEEMKVSKDMMKTLSVDTRVDILKLLERRPMTSSEISRALNKHVTTVSDHLEILKKSSLVERIERPGHKWVYYKLSRNADMIIHPKPFNRWVIILSLSFLVFSGFFISFVNANPGDPLYPLMKFKENVRLAFATNEYSKTELHLELAEKRLNEAKFVLDKNNTNSTGELIKEYKNELEKANSEIQKAKDNGKRLTPLLEEVSETKAKHIEIAKNIEKREPKLKGEIESAFDSTVGNQLNLPHVSENP